MDIKMIHQRLVDRLKRSNLNLFQFLIYLAIIIVAVIVVVRYYSDKVYVKNDYLITKGNIIKYDEIGIEPTIYITYSYTVNGEVYNREVCCPNKTFDECNKNISLCEKKRFIVIYSKKRPHKSLIDLTIEIQEIEIPDFPRDLTNFQ